ncbi:PH domain-containing protein [uncultured Pseudokineococcus sp.]|uniref:PH domain-containing protein n=1 Tax=uncultured Pseudokineococcus sp. TaxID=1642928 RepID=UPI00262DD0C4|nr:PH domain-containing protein [uncultured Pseudokineococcus sp.]
MTDPVDGEAASLRVDVDGLPQRIDLPTTKAQRRSSWAYLVLGVVYLGLQLLFGELHVAFVVLGVGWVLLGVLGLVVLSRAHLVLEPEGVRHVGLLGRTRLRPWSAVAEVRPPGAFHPSSYLRLPGGRFAETIDLPGVSADDARELQRRLEAARTAPEEAERPQA